MSVLQAQPVDLLVLVTACTASQDKTAWHSLVVWFAAGDDLASTGV